MSARGASPVDLLRHVLATLPDSPTPEQWQLLADACERAGMYALGRAVEGDHAARAAEERPQRRPRRPKP